MVKIWFFFGVKSWFFTWNTPKISCAPPNIGKIWFFGVKSWFFTRNTPKIFAPPFSRRNFFKCAPPNLKSWIRPWKQRNKFRMEYFNSIQFKALFRVDINHTYRNTSSNELLKSTMVYNNTYNHAYKHIKWKHTSIYAIQYRHKLQKQIPTEQKQAKYKRHMHLRNNKK